MGNKSCKCSVESNQQQLDFLTTVTAEVTLQEGHFRCQCLTPVLSWFFPGAFQVMEGSSILFKGHILDLLSLTCWYQYLTQYCTLLDTYLHADTSFPIFPPSSSQAYVCWFEARWCLLISTVFILCFPSFLKWSVWGYDTLCHAMVQLWLKRIVFKCKSLHLKRNMGVLKLICLNVCRNREYFIPIPN